jgi:hypothetical protein
MEAPVTTGTLVDTDVLYQLYTFADVVRAKVVLERPPNRDGWWRCHIKGAFVRLTDGTESKPVGAGRSPEAAVVSYANHIAGTTLAIYDGPGMGATLYDVPLFRRKP